MSSQQLAQLPSEGFGVLMSTLDVLEQSIDKRSNMKAEHLCLQPAPPAVAKKVASAITETFTGQQRLDAVFGAGLFGNERPSKPDQVPQVTDLSWWRPRLWDEISPEQVSE